mgnify:CR=1 FL=1
MRKPMRKEWGGAVPDEIAPPTEVSETAAAKTELREAVAAASATVKAEAEAALASRLAVATTEAEEAWCPPTFKLSRLGRTLLALSIITLALGSPEPGHGEGCPGCGGLHTTRL